MTTKHSKVKATTTLLITVPDKKPLLCENYERYRERMKKTTRRILKSSEVKMAGQFRLDLGAAAPVSADKTSKIRATSVPAQVNIVENNSEFVVIEVICGCGMKTNIRCDYIGAQFTEKHTGLQNDGENENESK